jgi:hypothetical protein
MKDLTHEFSIFRNYSCELWNSCFLKVIDPDRLSRQCWHYNSIIKRLFHVMLLEPYGIFLDLDSSFESLPPIFTVSTNHVRANNIYVSRDLKDSPYWDFDIKSYSLKGLELTFISFFDFEEIKKREFAYIKVLIKSLPENNNLVGFQALIPYDESMFFMKEA